MKRLLLAESSSFVFRKLVELPSPSLSSCTFIGNFLQNRFHQGKKVQSLPQPSLLKNQQVVQARKSLILLVGLVFCTSYKKAQVPPCKTFGSFPRQLWSDRGKRRAELVVVFVGATKSLSSFVEGQQETFYDQA